LKPDTISLLADHLAQARLGGDPTLLPPEKLQPGTMAEAYKVQDAIHERLTAKGYGPLVGHKIGCTTIVMQEYLSIDHPCSGEVFESTVYHKNADLKLSDFHRIGVECEIAARLSSDLRPTGTPYNRENIGDAVGALMAGIELVDDRYDNYPSFPAPTLVADDFFNAGVVLGKENKAWKTLDLQNLKGVMLIGGEEVGRGKGSDILGHPMEALAWLANQSISQEKPLQAGTFIMLGSVVKTVHLEKPAEVTIRFDELGEVSVKFA